MHWQLIAGIDWFLSPQNWPIILQVALGIGMVIFVHELGHFAVAKACGVKCEKFYLGFDIGGWKLFKYKWGETEYGIGVLPLGGYVKMLGQDDNPNRLHEEMERAKLRTAEGEPIAGETIEGDTIFDPRSYLAKSVPQRMAIISAGVIMNVIFAFVVSSIAYGMGVKQVACVVGKVWPGDPAWKADLREGDDVRQIGNVKNPTFRDLQSGVSLGDNIDQGVDFIVKRPGVEELLKIKVFPKRRKLIPLIGMSNGHTNEIGLVLPRTLPKSANLQAGDKVLAINGTAVSEGWQVDRLLEDTDGGVTLTIERTETQEGKPTEKPTVKRVEAELPAVPMRTFGLVMAAGKVAEVQNGSPADAAEIRAGDVIKEIDGQELGDPMHLADRLRHRENAAAKVTIVRGEQTLTKDVNLNLKAYDNSMLGEDSPVALPALGVAIYVENQVAAVEPGSPAEAAGVKVGDTIKKATLVPPDDKLQEEKYGRKGLQKTKEIEFAERDTSFISRLMERVFGQPAEPKAELRNWPIVFHLAQDALPKTQLQLELSDDRTVKLDSVPASDWFNHDRELLFEPVVVMQKAETIGDSLALGWRETKYSLSLVFRFLRKLMSGQVSVKGIGGPVEIARQAGAMASEGMSPFLLFLGMLSANLAVLNFLPIPMLDGGHMVFLAAEGVRGKPVSERVVALFTTAGLVLLLSLMVFVLLLDVGLISRG